MNIRIALISSLAVIAAAGASYAADLQGIEVPVVDQVDLGRWDRAFGGVFVGAAHATAYEFGDANTVIDSFDGAMLGVTGGLDVTLENGVVVGLVGDLAWSDLHGRVDGIDSDIYRINWVGSARGRIGYDAGAFLPYLTGGVAIADGETSSLDQTVYQSALYVGWTVGAGVEYAVSDQLSVDLLYRYSNYGDETFEWTVPFSGVSSVGYDTHQVTAGLNWSF